jgi:acyl-CoA thioesterase I
VIGCPIRALDFAKVGATSRWGLQVVAQVAQAIPDIVIVEFATNDAAMHRRISLRESAANVTSVIRSLRSADANVRIYLMTMSPAIGFRGLIRWRLNRYYDVYTDLAAREHTGLIENRPAWTSLPHESLTRALPDGTHPTAEFSLSITLANVVRILTRDLGIEPV